MFAAYTADIVLSSVTCKGALSLIHEFFCMSECRDGFLIGITAVTAFVENIALFLTGRLCPFDLDIIMLYGILCISGRLL